MDFSQDPYYVFQEDLRPGERLLWTGQPNPNRLLTAADGCMIPFSLMWGGFAFFWEAMAIGAFLKAGGMGIIMVLWGLPFCAVGAWLIFGRFFTLRSQRKRTYYGVTDQRLLFVTLGRNRQMQYIPIDRDLNVQKTARTDGTGSLAFGDKQMPAWVATAAMSRRTGAQIPAFTEIREVDEVARIIDRQMAVLPQPARATS